MNDTVLEFLRHLGLAGVSWNGRSLSLQSPIGGESLYFEQTKGGLLIAEFFEIQEHDIPEKANRALRLVHPDQQHPFSIQTGMKGDRLIAFMVVIPENVVSVSCINDAFSIFHCLKEKVIA